MHGAVPRLSQRSLATKSGKTSTTDRETESGAWPRLFQAPPSAKRKAVPGGDREKSRLRLPSGQEDAHHRPRDRRRCVTEIALRFGKRPKARLRKDLRFGKAD